jgi:FkbM family methyltransferase
MKTLRDIRFRLFYWVLLQKAHPLLTLGKLCPWTIAPGALNKDSVVVSAGAGHDISFETELIDTFGCKVILLDPSPTGKATFERNEAHHCSMIYVEKGLSERSGIHRFSEPEDRNEGSYRTAALDGPSTVAFDCLSLPDLQRRFAFERIDLLKIDIEGAEYGVIRDALQKRLAIHQLCVEFHYDRGFPHNRWDLIRHLVNLRIQGYRLIHLRDRDHTFIRSR